MEREPAGPCCDYRDHSGDHPACACPEAEHAGDPVHPFAIGPDTERARRQDAAFYREVNP